MTSAVIYESPRPRQFFSCIPPQGCAFVSKGKHVAHRTFRAAVIFLLSIFVRQQLPPVVADDFVHCERSRNLHASSATREVSYYLQAVPCLRGDKFLDLVQLQQHTILTAVNP